MLRREARGLVPAAIVRAYGHSNRGKAESRRPTDSAILSLRERRADFLAFVTHAYETALATLRA
jgi:hypothetical protein